MRSYARGKIRQNSLTATVDADVGTVRSSNFFQALRHDKWQNRGMLTLLIHK